MARFPPLAALRAFESAARHRSFTKAASELFLTQSAVSRHVRNIEEFFGFPLFERKHRSVVLTPEGETYMRELVEAFSRIDLATRRIKHSDSQDILNIHAYTTFAMQWLIPRLRAFHDANPEINVQLTASVQPIDLEKENIHCAIRTQPADWGAGIRADKLFDSLLIPVCSPHFELATWPNVQPSDLQRVTLLHSLSRAADWRIWLQSVGSDIVDANSGMKFESSAMAYLAAQKGMGVAIAQRFLVQDELRMGTLKQIFPQAVRSDRTYYFLSSPRYIGHAALETFRGWLLSELPLKRDMASETTKES